MNPSNPFVKLFIPVTITTSLHKEVFPFVPPESISLWLHQMPLSSSISGERETSSFVSSLSTPCSTPLSTKFPSVSQLADFPVDIRLWTQDEAGGLSLNQDAGGGGSSDSLIDALEGPIFAKAAFHLRRCKSSNADFPLLPSPPCN